MLAIPDDMKVGIPKIDEQHLELLRRFLELSSNESQSPLQEEIQKTFELLGIYVNQHFNDEEAYQKESDYPMYEWHRKQHQTFVQSLQKLQKDYIAGGVSTMFLMDLDNTLIGWFKDHIKGADVVFGKYYRDKNNA